MWSGPGIDKLLHFLIVLVNFTLEKDSYLDKSFDRTSLSKHKLICWSWAELKVWWKACQKSFNSMYRFSLNWMVFVAGNLHFLIQFIRFQGLLFLDMISWIFSSKNDLFILLTISLNIFQSKLDLNEWYMFSLLLHSYSTII